MVSLTDDQCREVLAADAEYDGNATAAANHIGLTRSTYRSRLATARQRVFPDTSDVSDALVELPKFPDDDIPAEQILDHMETRFAKRQAHADAQNWFAVKLLKDEPIAWNWFGDPHIGSNGCNIPLLRRDVDTVVKTPGMYAASIGDVADNWTGRLMRLYADNDVSRQTERRLATWFLQEAEIPWALWLHGNHDVMDGALVAHLEAINASRIPMVDWRAKFRVCFPNGCEIRVDAAHNHKGHSMWNPLHGQIRAATMDEQADLYIAGHRHEWALAQRELPGGRVVNLARCRGYKYLDEYAHRGNFHVQQSGASIVTIFNPVAGSPIGRVQMFADVEAGADYLTWLRNKA